MNDNSACSVCGEPATAACNAPECRNAMCDEHMYARLTRSFGSRHAERPDSDGPSGRPLQWFCETHKDLADQ